MQYIFLKIKGCKSFEDPTIYVLPYNIIIYYSQKIQIQDQNKHGFSLHGSRNTSISAEMHMQPFRQRLF